MGGLIIRTVLSGSDFAIVGIGIVLVWIIKYYAGVLGVNVVIVVGYTPC